MKMKLLRTYYGNERQSALATEGNTFPALSICSYDLKPVRGILSAPLGRTPCMRIDRRRPRKEANPRAVGRLTLGQ